MVPKHSPLLHPRPVRQEVASCCSLHTLGEQVQVAGAFCGGPGSRQPTPHPSSSIWSRLCVQRLSPEAARLFMPHPRRSCDFHMVSPPSLISAKSTGKRERNDLGVFFCKQRTLRLKPTRTSCRNVRFLRRNVTLQRGGSERQTAFVAAVRWFAGICVICSTKQGQSFVTALHTPTKLQKHTAVGGP